MQQNEPLSYSFVSVEVAEAIGNELELVLLTWRIICGILGKIIEFT